MLEDWFRPIELSIPFEQWERLPRLAGFKNEYFNEKAVWTPRPKTYNAVLDLSEVNASELLRDAATAIDQSIRVRPLDDADWSDLPAVFVSAFHSLPPFCALSDDETLVAASDCLNHTRRGGDGEFLPTMSVVAVDGGGALVGAVLVTRWKSEPGDDIEARPTDAHITWAFVRHYDRGRGVGTLMLSDVVERLRAHTVTRLFTTFFAGNDASMLWHWRNGFRLLPNMGSMRKLHLRG